MNQEKIDRINQLARKSKMPEGLTPEEKSEQAQLRQEYRNDFKQSLMGHLNSITVVEKDGSKHKLIPDKE